MFKWVIGWYRRTTVGESGETQVCYTGRCDFRVSIPEENLFISVKVLLGSVI